MQHFQRLSSSPRRTTIPPSDKPADADVDFRVVYLLAVPHCFNLRRCNTSRPWANIVRLDPEIKYKWALFFRSDVGLSIPFYTEILVLKDDQTDIEVRHL